MAFRQMDRQWKQTLSSVLYESLLQYKRGLCSAVVPLHCCKTKACIEGQQECWPGHVLNGTKTKPSFSSFCCKLFIFSSFFTHLPKRPTTIPPLSVLEPLFPVSLCSQVPWWLPILYTVQVLLPFTQSMSRFSCPHTLNSPSFALQLSHWHSFFIM